MAATEFSNNPLFSSPSLQAYYKLENTTDSGPAAHTLSNNNAATFVAAKFNNGVLTDTTGSKYLFVNNALSATGTVSFGGWIGVNTAPSSGQTHVPLYWGQGSHKADVYITYTNTAGTLSVGFYRTRTNISNDGFEYTFTLSTTPTNPTHVWLDYDGSTVRGYISGVEVGPSAASSGDGSGTTSDEFAIGAFYRNASASSICTMTIDDVPFFNVSLTAAQIASIALGSTTPTPPRRIKGAGITR